MRVDREHEARVVGPGLNLQLHVRIPAISQPECVDRRLAIGRLARALKRVPVQQDPGVDIIRPDQPARDRAGKTPTDTPVPDKSRQPASMSRVAARAGHRALPPQVGSMSNSLVAVINIYPRSLYSQRR